MKKQQSLISQDWEIFGDICGLDHAHALSVFRNDYRGALFSSCPLPVRVALSVAGVLSSCLRSTGKCPASFRTAGTAFLCP